MLCGRLFQCWLEVIFPAPQFGKYLCWFWLFEATVLCGRADDIGMRTAQKGIGESLRGDV